jgi:hypothetical protein
MAQQIYRVAPVKEYILKADLLKAQTKTMD